MKTPKDPRHQARRLAISVLYAIENSHDQGAPEIPQLIITSKENLEIEEYDHEMVDNILSGVSANSDKLREIISNCSIDWKLDKIYKIDLAILLAAIWELLNTKSPSKVIIDEAVELAKEFGEVESPKFINGILAGVLKKYGQQ